MRGAERRIYSPYILDTIRGSAIADTTVFQSGNSQAVRLPKEYRFKSKTVEIFRRGNEVVLREKARTMGDIIRGLPNLGEDFALDRSGGADAPLPSWDDVK